MTAVVDAVQATPGWLLEHPATLGGLAAVAVALVGGVAYAWLRLRRLERVRNQTRFGSR